MIFDFFRKKFNQPRVHVDKYLIHIKDIKQSTITINTRDDNTIKESLAAHIQILQEIKTVLEQYRDEPVVNHLLGNACFQQMFQQTGQQVKNQSNAGRDIIHQNGTQLNADGDIHYHPAPPSVEESYLPHPPNTATQHLFIGRDRALEQLTTAINAQKTVLITAIEGMAGVGKSYLVDHFALTMGYEDRYTVLALNPQQLDRVEDLLTRLAKHLQVEPQLVVNTLKSQNWLVHIENVDSDPAAKVTGQLLGQLTGCRLVLTGRLSGLGHLPQCQTIELTPFSIQEGVQQLQEELTLLNAEPLTTAEAQQLVTALGGLPLAIHLAAGYLVREGVDAFLQQFRDTAFNLPPKNPLEQGRDAKRLIIKKTFELSLNLLTPEQRQAVAVMAYAPPEGIGLNLVAALMDKKEQAAQQQLHQIAHLSLVIDLRQQRTDPLRWKMHPLLAELMRVDHEAESIQARLHDWFMARLPKPEGEDYSAWHSVQAEEAALNQYLATASLEQGIELERAGSYYADLNGSWWHWLQFCQHLLTQTVTDEQRSHILWTCCRCAQRLGEFKIAEQAAKMQSELGKQLKNEEAYISAQGKIADILEARGELEEALRIRTEEELPVYERLGDVRSLLILRVEIAILLMSFDTPNKEEAQNLLCLALTAARRLKIPEAETIEGILAHYDMNSP